MPRIVAWLAALASPVLNQQKGRMSETFAQVMVVFPGPSMEIEGLVSGLGRRGPLTQKVFCLATSASHILSCSGVRNFSIFSRPAVRFLARY